MNRRQASMQWVCFTCRKVFKRPEFDASARVACPDCAAPMTLMGTAFRAPRRADLAQWRTVEALARHGFLFHRHAGSRPERLNEVAGFLEAQRLKARNRGQVLLERIGSHAAAPITSARAQGRVRREPGEGKPRFSLAGRTLEPWQRIAVMVEGRWCRGIFRVRSHEDGSSEPYVQLGAGLEDIPLTANTVCRLEP